MIEDLATHPARYVTLEELSEYLAVSERTLLAHAHKGALVVVRFGRCVRVPIEAACEYATIRYLGTKRGDPKRLEQEIVTHPAH